MGQGKLSKDYDLIFNTILVNLIELVMYIIGFESVFEKFLYFAESCVYILDARAVPTTGR